MTSCRTRETPTTPPAGGPDLVRGPCGLHVESARLSSSKLQIPPSFPLIATGTAIEQSRLVVAATSPQELRKDYAVVLPVQVKTKNLPPQVFFPLQFTATVMMHTYHLLIGPTVQVVA